MSRSNRPAKDRPDPSMPAGRSRLGSLSERYESGGRGPGTVSTGRDDPGGVSYGLYQFATRTGTVAAFLAGEGQGWLADFGTAVPGTPAFSAIWRAIAAREPDRFAAAQHAFIERTHYRPVVAAVRDRTGLDLDRGPRALRDVAWSCAVQHAAAARIMVAAVGAADAALARTAPGFPAALVRAIYAARADYLARLGARAGGAVKTLFARIVAQRYPAECAAALAMIDEDAPPMAPAPAGPA